MANERKELVAALHQFAAFAEEWLALSQRVVATHDTYQRPIAQRRRQQCGGLAVSHGALS
jgi:hypothetical protein